MVVIVMFSSIHHHNIISKEKELNKLLSSTQSIILLTHADIYESEFGWPSDTTD